MNNTNTKNRSVFLMVIVVAFGLTACTSTTNIVGKWQSIHDSGTIEFKSDGRFVIVDNMSATSKGNYKITEKNNLSRELTHSNIMKESIQPVNNPEVVKAQFVIIKNELQITRSSKEKSNIEIYRRTD
jgi:hypothetical protein